MNNDYDRELLSKISNKKHWPGLTNAPLIVHLLSVANKQITNNTLEGVLSATLIYQQVMEDLLLNLLKMSHLYVQGEIWPSQISFPINKKLMFGQLLDQHKLSIDFDQKDLLISTARNFNQMRVKIVHKIVQSKGPNEIVTLAGKIHSDFHKFLDLFYTSRAFLDWKLEDLSNRVDWKGFLAELE